MTLLLDTNVWLWWMEGDEKLSAKANLLIADPTNQILVSAISVWEVVLKTQIGKLEVSGDLVAATSAQGIALHPFTAAHAQAVGNLPLHHRDPFDRALIAQAVNDRLTLLTGDFLLAQYAADADLALVLAV